MQKIIKLFAAAWLAWSAISPATAQEALELTDIRYQGTVGQVVWIELAEHLATWHPSRPSGWVTPSVARRTCRPW